MPKLMALLTPLAGIVVFLGTTTVLVVRGLHVSPDPAGAPERKSAGAQKTASWVFHNPELDQLIAELKTEKATLASRGQQLQELEIRLQTERSELDQVAQKIKVMQADFDREILRVKEDETANLKKLARIYATMEPDGAAIILRELDDAVLVKILVFMKDGETAPILEALARTSNADARRAAEISDRLRTASAKPQPNRP